MNAAQANKAGLLGLLSAALRPPAALAPDGSNPPKCDVHRRDPQCRFTSIRDVAQTSQLRRYRSFLTR